MINRRSNRRPTICSEQWKTSWIWSQPLSILGEYEWGALLNSTPLKIESHNMWCGKMLKISRKNPIKKLLRIEHSSRHPASFIKISKLYILSVPRDAYKSFEYFRRVCNNQLSFVRKWRTICDAWNMTLFWYLKQWDKIEYNFVFRLNET